MRRPVPSMSALAASLLLAQSLAAVEPAPTRAPALGEAAALPATPKAAAAAAAAAAGEAAPTPTPIPAPRVASLLAPNAVPGPVITVVPPPPALVPPPAAPPPTASPMLLGAIGGAVGASLLFGVVLLVRDRRRERALSAKGLAVDIDAKGTGVILLTHPDRAPSTRIVRDKQREAEVRAAAAAIPDVDPFAEADEASGITQRILAKQQTARHKGSTRRLLGDAQPRQSNGDTGRIGMTLIEVMIVIMLLVVGVLGAMSHTVTLARARSEALWKAQVQQVANIVSERLQGVVWGDLRNLSQPSSAWARPRFSIGTAVNPPMIDGDDPDRGLAALGIAVEPSGVPELKVYVEYYRGEIMEQGFTTRAEWRAAMARTTPPIYRLDNGAKDVAIGEELMVIRILCTYAEIDGTATQRHEIFTTRKK